MYFKECLPKIPLRIDCHNPHLPQKSSYTFGSNQYAHTLYEVYHTDNSLSRVLVVFFIHFAHQIKIFRSFINRFIIESTPIQIHNLTLTAVADSFSGTNYLFEGFSIPNCSEALLQKSTSISNLPIFSNKAFSRFSASSSGALVEKISGLRERNSLFQVDIICGCIPKRLDSSLSVSCSLIASMATCALKAALCFFLLVFIRVKLIILLNLPSGLNLREYYNSP